MPLDCKPDLDPLAVALAHKAYAGARGAVDRRVVAAGQGWRVVDVVCTCGPRDRPFEEQHEVASISLVLSGAFVARSGHGSSLLSPGSLFLGTVGRSFECSHDHGEGDRCLSFQFDAGLFERLAHDAGAARGAFPCHRLPPLRALARLTAQARAALAAPERLEEIALELAGAVLELAADTRPDRSATARHQARIAEVLRQAAPRIAEPLTVGELARTAGLSPYHFLRTFKRVTGVTPHQWLLRARLREAAERLVSSRAPITDIALDVGFDDLSNFINSFRAEFGVSPRCYRKAA
jgi:AraC-like DNA-binding protein